MFLLNDNPLPIDTPFEINGTHYPANWLRMTSIEEKNAVGIVEIPDVIVTYDDRFYWGIDNPKQLDDITVTPVEGDEYVQHGLKYQWIAQIKDTTNKLLAPSDWMVIRKFERNVSIPTATAVYRALVLAECTRLVNAITTCVDVSALITIVSMQDWPINE
jgi:hypothetical protein